MFVIGSNGASTGYNLTRSLRFRRSASANLSRTFGSGGNRQIFTFSLWLKRGALSSSQFQFIGVDAGGSNEFVIKFGAADTLTIYDYQSAYNLNLVTTQVFRDPSAWYHIVVAIDTTQATAANRVKLYINGTQVTAFGTATYPSQNYNTMVNYTVGTSYRIGVLSSSLNYFDGYLTEINFIDGQALTPSSFGSTNALTGVWQPAAYTGSYGTNGFELNFSDNSALTTASNVGLGKDFSGNANYWVTNNISITAGVTYDSMTDVPTLTSATAANFAVLNPLKTAGTVTNANLGYVATAFADQNVFASMALPSATKIYFEATFTTGTVAGVYAGIGIATQDISLSTGLGTVTNSWAIESNQAIDSINRVQGVATSYGGGTYFGNNDVCMVAVDQASGKIWYGKNGTWFSSGDPAAGTNAAATTVSTTATLFPASTIYGTSPVLAFNFGQQPFTYTAPTGFVALNTYNLPTSTIVKGNTVMDATLYTGTGASLSVTNTASFKPDLVWIKSRPQARSHRLQDSVRGVGNRLASDQTAAEVVDASSLTSFDTGGFSLGTNINYNTSAEAFVAWQWQAGQGTTSSNTSGTITSTVSVNASAGFSVVTWTGTGANATVGHGLGVAPQLIINKPRNAADNWISWHTSLGALGYIYLNLTNASASAAAVWNSTLPTSSVFSVGTSSNINTSAQTMVSYCWTPIAGFSAFGSYTGNGSADGPFVYTGFRPKWVMVKRTDASGNWWMYDTSRSTYNAAILYLFADSSAAEVSDVTEPIDFLSNGFKLKIATYQPNTSGATFIYMAFAENPFKNALAR